MSDIDRQTDRQIDRQTEKNKQTKKTFLNDFYSMELRALKYVSEKLNLTFNKHLLSP